MICDIVHDLSNFILNFPTLKETLDQKFLIPTSQQKSFQLHFQLCACCMLFYRLLTGTIQDCIFLPKGDIFHVIFVQCPRTFPARIITVKLAKIVQQFYLEVKNIIT